MDAAIRTKNDLLQVDGGRATVKEEEGLKRRGGAAEEGERVRKMSRLEREEELIRQAMGRKSSRKVGCTHIKFVRLSFTLFLF